MLKSHSVLAGVLALAASCTKSPAQNPQPSQRDNTANVENQMPQTAAPKDVEKAKPAEIEGPNARVLCTRPDKAPKTIATIPDFIELINALPKPVTVSCVLDVLERPFYLKATSNIFSAQPAYGDRSPRIFLFVGEKLVVSVVPSGSGSKVIEFGYRTDNVHSVKGEIHFPVTEILLPDAAYTSILDESGSRTNCYACHSGERQAGEGFPASAMSSNIVKPMATYDVPLSKLERLSRNCQTEKANECDVIQAIFFQGQVKEREFP